MRRVICIVFSISIILFLMFFIFSAGGCRKISGKISEKVEEKLSEGEAESKGSDETSGSVSESDVLDLVPLHPDASITSSSESTKDEVWAYHIEFDFKGSLDHLSSWYENSFGENWDVVTQSAGDYECWAEFYIEAENSNYYLIIYLYKDSDSEYINGSIDLEAKSGSVASEQCTEEVTEDGAETSESDEEDFQPVTHSAELTEQKIAFVCASVGSAWNINDHFPDLDITVHDEYQFDKGYVIGEILSNDKPDIMIIKECAAYFPPEDMGTSMNAYENLRRDWVNLCRGEGAIPVLTTVVPVDPSNYEGMLESILKFNDWIRQYCEGENISILDLEEALRLSDDDRMLDPRYDSGDGLHPNDIAYSEKLDHILIPALEMALSYGY